MGAAAACVLAALFFAGAVAPAQAQQFLSYRCRDGTAFVAAFYQGSRTAYLQLDGKALRLPRKISASGARYAKDGVTFWMRGSGATLKRGGETTECRTD
jgi:membrane-bound inhibitor of C-type lysozyme